MDQFIEQFWSAVRCRAREAPAGGGGGYLKQMREMSS